MSMKDDLSVILADKLPASLTALPTPLRDILLLSLDDQKKIARDVFKCGDDDFGEWQEFIRNFDEKDREQLEQEICDEYTSDFTKAEIERKIYDLKTNPYAIEFYRRITDNYDLTVEEQIKHLRSLKTVD